MMLVNATFAAVLFASCIVASAAGAGKELRILAFGDSLTAGFGVSPGEAFPVRLEAHLAAAGTAASVSNAGVSGDTTAGGLARIDWAIGELPDIVIVELGANDALRGIDPAVTRANLSKILDKLRSKGIPTLLVGMYAPPNWGREYQQQFDAIYPDLARQFGATLYPFFLDGVAMDPQLNQPDGLHPNARGVDVIANRIAPLIRQIAGRLSQSGAAR